MEILAELKEGRVEIKKNKEKFKMKRGMLVIHKDGQDPDLDYWRTVIPDSTPVKNFVVTELHAVPYSIHPGMQRTLQKVRRHFYWKGTTGDIREYVESCPICQVEKADHTLARGKLQSTNIPEKKWSRYLWISSQIYQQPGIKKIQYSLYLIRLLVWYI